MANVISYDSKLLNTLQALLLRPGKITRDYINGKRASYTNPFKFLLSLSIIYFLIINYSNDFSFLDKNRSSIFPTAKEISEFNDNEVTLFNTLKEKNDSILLYNPKKYFNSLKDSSRFNSLFYKSRFFKTLIKHDSIYSFNDAINKHHITDNYENKLAYNSANGIQKLEQQPSNFAANFISKLPFTAFFFLPIFAFFIWMIYIRKNYTYTDHIIFSFHNQSLFFILLTVSYVLNTTFDINSQSFFLLIFLIYLYKAMRNFYQQRRFITVIKYLFLNTIFILLAIIALTTVLMGSIFTF